MNSLFRHAAHLGMNALQGFYAPLGQALGLIDFPVPPNSALRKTGPKGLRQYYESGIRCYLPIATMARYHDLDLDGPLVILDFGCGVGRQLLHFTKRFPNPKYLACDVDHTHIRFMRKHYPSVDSYCTSFTPPLPFETSSIDMVYSVSVFSHLSPDDQLPWLKELFRVVRPGGFCFLTTEGRTALKMVEKMFSPSHMQQELTRTGVLYREYAWLEPERTNRFRLPVAKLGLGIEGSYGNTVVTPEFVRTNWVHSGFDVIDIVEGIIDHRQDLITLRKRIHI